MAGALKTDFIEAVRLTPDGINDFLETPIPEAPTAAPADDTATEALSSFLLDLFRVFAGLTPVELLLRIGQHNSVLESAMIAGLEYIEGSDSDENSIEIIQPGEGIDYAPGEMRFAALVANGDCLGVTLTLGENDPVSMYLVDEKWLQYVDMTAGEYSATMTATFEDESTSNATVNFSVATAGEEPPPGEDPPEQPGGKDTEALSRLRSKVLSALGDIVRFNNGDDFADFEQYRTAFVSAVRAFLSAYTKTSDFIERLKSAIDTDLAFIEAATEIEVVKTAASRIMTNINILYRMATEG